MEGFALLLVFDLSIAISLSRWSFRSSIRPGPAGAGLLGQVPAVEGSLIQL